MLARLAEKELQCVGRGLDRLDGGRRRRRRFFLLFLDDQFDAAAVELLVDRVRLEWVELERLDELVQVDLAKLPACLGGLEQRRKFLVYEDRLDLDRQVCSPWIDVLAPIRFPAPSHNPNT